jgi:hypothetical protein
MAMAATFAQEPAAKPENPSLANEKAAPAKAENHSARGQEVATKAEEKAALPFQIELLETHVRFEANGDSRKEVHTIVKVNDAAGARQFARVGFDYNRGFQAVEIPLVKITHANGGTSEVLPSAITDVPNPAVEKFPAYQDVRVKSVRILGLQEGDTLEYRVITTTTKPPLAPDFWLEHSFDRSGQVAEENYALDLPGSRGVQIFISPATPARKEEHKDETDGSARTHYVWHRTNTIDNTTKTETVKSEPDLVLTTYATWDEFANRLGDRLKASREEKDALSSKAKEIAKGEAESVNWIFPIYEFVSQRIKTVDLPLGATGFRTRPATEILASGYGTPEDKFVLFAALVQNCCGVQAGLAHSSDAVALGGIPRPDVFDHLLVAAGAFTVSFWMDLNPEVAPFGMIPSQFRGKTALLVKPGLNETWRLVPKELPVKGLQKVGVDAAISSNGELKASVKYVMRGDNELVLRMAFHQAPKERWKEVAGLLALADGFRGEITKVMASDPMETKDPFTVEYEITQPKFVDWAKKPVRIPALLPQIALPDAPGKGAGEKIELGTPLEVETRLTLRLPEGTQVQTPPGTSVARDYATYASKYEGHLNTLTATRHVHFLMQELPGERTADYGAFVRAVQLDQAQVIALFPAELKEKRK